MTDLTEIKKTNSEWYRMSSCNIGHSVTYMIEKVLIFHKIDTFKEQLLKIGNIFLYSVKSPELPFCREKNKKFQLSLTILSREKQTSSDKTFPTLMNAPWFLIKWFLIENVATNFPYKLSWQQHGWNTSPNRTNKVFINSVIANSIWHSYHLIPATTIATRVLSFRVLTLGRTVH